MHFRAEEISFELMFFANSTCTFTGDIEWRNFIFLSFLDLDRIMPTDGSTYILKAE